MRTISDADGAEPADSPWYTPTAGIPPTADDLKSSLSWAAGAVTSTAADLNRFTHSGGLDSYSSYSVIFPADRSSVVVLCNFPGNGLPNFVLGLNGIRSIMLGR